MPLDLFGQRPRNDPAIPAAIKGWAAQVFGLGERATVLVTELRCTEPGCPPLETVVAILSSGPTRQFKVPKAMAEVTFEDVARLAGPSSP
jgi:hypothetical protein